MDLNKVFLIGNLTRDPETRYTQSGAQVTNFSIAVNDRSRGKQNETTMFVRIETWEKNAEIAAKYLQKGSEVMVEGQLKIDEYETKDGQKRRDPVVRAHRFSMGRRPQGGGSGGGYGGGQDDDYQQRSAPRQDRAQEPNHNYSDSAPADSGQGSGNTEDDLPF